MTIDIRYYITKDNQHIIEKAINDRIYLEDLETDLTDNTNEYLKCLTDLTHLKIVNRENKGHIIIDLTHLTNLKVLKIDSGHTGSKILFPNLKNLECIDIFGCYLENVDFLKMTNLKEIHIINCDVVKIDLSMCMNLKSIQVCMMYSHSELILPESTTNIEYLGISKVKDINMKHYTKLKTFQIWEDEPKIISFKHNKNLTRIIAGCKTIHIDNDDERCEYLLKGSLIYRIQRV